MMKTENQTNAHEILGKVSLLSEKMTGNTYLMQNPDGEQFVQKFISAEKLSIYKQLQTLKHQGLADVLVIKKEKAGYLVVTEYIPGETLASKLEKVGKLNEADALNFIRQLCLVLDKVHQRGIIHRDITPNNIIITPEKKLKLIDFGIARIYKESQNEDTQLLGTPGYAAPEQFGFDQTNASSDIFALGVLLNVMLTGKKPNEKVVKNERLAKIIKACTAMEPAIRYQDVLQVDYDLRQLHVPNTYQEQPLTQVPSSRKNKTFKTVALTAISTTIVCGLIGLFLFWFILPSTSETPESTSNPLVSNTLPRENETDIEEPPTENPDPISIPAAINAEDLIGVWGHGTGDTLSMNISGLTGTYIAFTEEGLMSTATERGRLFSDEFNNSSLFTFLEPNTITIGSNEYTVSIEGNRLTIERDGSQRMFQRVD